MTNRKAKEEKEEGLKMLPRRERTHVEKEKIEKEKKKGHRRRTPASVAPQDSRYGKSAAYCTRHTQRKERKIKEDIQPVYTRMLHTHDGLTEAVGGEVCERRRRALGQGSIASRQTKYRKPRRIEARVRGKKNASRVPELPTEP